MPRVSVIVSTFNRLDALQLVLRGYESSLYRDFEVIVADDGSSADTGDWVRSFARRVTFPLRHVFQADRGFRLAAVRNLAARHATGEILVLTDGDCVPYPDCLGRHASGCRPGSAQAGGRCDAEERETQALLAAPAGVDRATRMRAIRARETARLRGLRLRNTFYRAVRLKARPKLQTANAAVHRRDFERVNGFDERFAGWGYEDEDLARRLRASGVRVRDASSTALVLHLFHPVHASHRPSVRGSENYRYFKSGAFLLRPLRGLVRRDVRTLALELLGDVPPRLRPLAIPAPRAPEVSVYFGATLPRFPRLRGSVVVRVDPEIDAAEGARGLYRLLEARLCEFPRDE